MKKIAVIVAAFATYMVLINGATVAGQVLGGAGHALGGGLKLAGQVFVPAVYHGLTDAPAAPSKTAPTTPQTATNTTVK
jgi:hypothetical protein